MGKNRDTVRSLNPEQATIIDGNTDREWKKTVNLLDKW